MFKRPVIRAKTSSAGVFVSTVNSSGATVSRWVPDTSPKIVPSGTPGRVGEIIDLMRRPVPPSNKPPWRPHPDYIKIASFLPEEERQEYTTKCREWYENNPPKEVRVAQSKLPPWDYKYIAAHLKEPQASEYLTRWSTWFKTHPTPRPNIVEIDTKLLTDLFSKYPGRPPPRDERLKVMKEAGYPGEFIERAKAYTTWGDETEAVRQEILDLAFAKWPIASKPTPKPKPVSKVIKVVKKKT